MVQRLNLTRDQLASFLQDHEQIKQFERLFQVVSDEVAPFSVTEATILAGDAVASANQALASIEVMKSVLEYLDRAPAAASQEQVAALQEQITALQQTPPSKEYRTPRYGSFYDTTTQIPAAINTAYAMTFNTVDLSFGVTRGSPTSRIFVDRPNIYNIQFSAQVHKTSGGVGLVYVWLRKNGTNVPDSTGQIRIQGNDGETLAAWNYVIQLNDGDYIELMWEVDDTTVELLAEAATAIHPSIPSVILTVTDNISSMET
jgi:hypothetical protein